MVDQWILKILLSPLALLYGIVIAIRNGLYSFGLLRGVTFSLPVISIGNLSVGGTGKTPHTEYLIRLLHEYIMIGILSRGYRRKTTGYREVSISDDASNVGDEPLQFKRKFPHIPVAVAESRSLAIPLLVRSYPGIQLIILDDGFQHREVEPGLNILLTEYNRPYTRDWLLPVGRLREWPTAAERADIIIVTKCPPTISQQDMEQLRAEVMQDKEQKIFFSHYAYGNPYRMYKHSERIVLHEEMNVLLVAGIADTEYMMDYVRSRCNGVQLMEYNDHHAFSNFDVGDIERHFRQLKEEQEVVLLTTEKDAMRLDSHRELLQRLDLPIYILPVRVQILGDEPEGFDLLVKDWLLNFKR